MKLEEDEIHNVCIHMLQLLKVMKKGLKNNLIPKLKEGLIIKSIPFWPQKHLLTTLSTSL